MEAFEKWWKEQAVSKYNPGVELEYGDVWKAALEWALMNGDCGGHHCGSEIREELKE